jgi:pterin-4a-carbinolamine dehydratase
LNDQKFSRRKMLQDKFISSRSGGIENNFLPREIAMADIFISYRRSNMMIVDYLHEKLSDHFAKGSIFLDRRDIDPGTSFPDKIRTAVKDAAIVLALIGPDWISVQHERKLSRRLDLPDDWVRLELELALSPKSKVLPVLIEGATIPKEEQLPESLAGLLQLQWVTLSRDHFRDDVEKLIETITSDLATKRTSELLNNNVNPYPTKVPNFKPAAIEGEQLSRRLSELPHWRLVESELDDDPRYETGYKRIEITRVFNFAKFLDAIDFMKAAAEQIDPLNHHPRWQNVFRTVTVSYSSWDIGHKLSDRDFQSAKMLEKIYAKFIANRK